MVEAENAELLAAHGEKLMPLLLTGETRCGKTSAMCEVARHFEAPIFRMSIGSVIGSHMGETAKAMKAALDEAALAPHALWILDEVDGIFQQRHVETGGGGCVQEMNSALAVGLATIEALPPHVMLVATTNEPGIIDRAMLARFRRVDFPAWSELDPDERRRFAKSHGCELAWDTDSYARVVQQARTVRVREIIAEAGRTKCSP
jgi:AAA+ superfamily predicted ATPase